MTVIWFVCHEGTSSLVPSFPESESRDIFRSGVFSVFRGFVNLFEGGLSNERLV